jgi:hypothetical protein
MDIAFAIQNRPNRDRVRRLRNHFLGHSIGSEACSGDTHGLSQFYDEPRKIGWSVIIPEK